MVALYAKEAILMALTERTHALPTEVLTPFEQAVSAGKRSALIAGLLGEWLEEQRREQLRRGSAEAILPFCGAWQMSPEERERIEREIEEMRLVEEGT
jgi:hypothetical protein